MFSFRYDDDFSSFRLILWAEMPGFCAKPNSEEAGRNGSQNIKQAKQVLPLFERVATFGGRRRKRL